MSTNKLKKVYGVSKVCGLKSVDLFKKTYLASIIYFHILKSKQKNNSNQNLDKFIMLGHM